MNDFDKEIHAKDDGYTPPQVTGKDAPPPEPDPDDEHFPIDLIKITKPRDGQQYDARRGQVEIELEAEIGISDDERDRLSDDLSDDDDRLRWWLKGQEHPDGQLIFTGRRGTVNLRLASGRYIVALRWGRLDKEVDQVGISVAGLSG